MIINILMNDRKSDDELIEEAGLAGRFDVFCGRLARTYLNGGVKMGKTRLILTGAKPALLELVALAVYGHFSPCNGRRYRIKIDGSSRGKVDVGQDGYAIDVGWFAKPGNADCL